MSVAYSNGDDAGTALCMARDNLDDLPDVAPSPGWSLRWYQPGDAANWEHIHRAAERHRAISPGLFCEQFGTDEQLLAQRQCYLLSPTGEAVGTATAWFDNEFQGGRWGRMHWVAVLPIHQGQGLGRVLMSAGCRRLRELGHDRAFLRTSAMRLPAIRLYRRFGFRPFPRDAGEERAWRDILVRLDWTA